MLALVTDCPSGYHWVWEDAYSGYCEIDDVPTPDPTPDPTPTSTVQPLEILNTEEEIRLNKHLSNINTMLLTIYSSLSNQSINLIQGSNLTSNQFLYNQQQILISINSAIGTENTSLIGGTLTCESLFTNNTNLLKSLATALGANIPSLQGV